jgi:hypothetical protein
VIFLIRIGFVGSSERHWNKQSKIKATQKISEILNQCIIQYGKENIVFVSGRSKKGGIDVWAEITAISLGVETKIYPAEVEKWDDLNEMIADPHPSPMKRFKGYMSRNIDIAKTSDILFCIDPKGRDGGGGQWTMNYARKLNKEVHHIVI